MLTGLAVVSDHGSANCKKPVTAISAGRSRNPPPIRVIRVIRGPPPLANHESHELHESPTPMTDPPIRVIRLIRGPPPLANHESHELHESPTPMTDPPIRVIRVIRGPPPLANHESHELHESPTPMTDPPIRVIGLIRGPPPLSRISRADFRSYCFEVIADKSGGATYALSAMQILEVEVAGSLVGAPGLQNQCGAFNSPGWVRFPFTSAISPQPCALVAE